MFMSMLFITIVLGDKTLLFRTNTWVSQETWSSSFKSWTNIFSRRTTGRLRVQESFYCFWPKFWEGKRYEGGSLNISFIERAVGSLFHSFIEQETGQRNEDNEYNHDDLVVDLFWVYWVCCCCCCKSKSCLSIFSRMIPWFALIIRISIRSQIIINKKKHEWDKWLSRLSFPSLF